MEPQPRPSGSPKSVETAEAFTIRVEAIGPDGTAYVAEMDVLFPRGTRITNVRALPAADPQGK